MNEECSQMSNLAYWRHTNISKYGWLKINARITDVWKAVGRAITDWVYMNITPRYVLCNVLQFTLTQDHTCNEHLKN